MHPNLGPQLMFNQDTVALPSNALARVMRMFFLDKGITNDGFLETYQNYFKADHSKLVSEGHGPIIAEQIIASDRKFLTAGQKIPPLVAKRIVDAMGYKVVELEINDPSAKLSVVPMSGGLSSTYSSWDAGALPPDEEPVAKAEATTEETPQPVKKPKARSRSKKK